MIKYILLLLIAAATGFALWFYSWTGPQQLNFADRMYPGAADAPSRTHVAIPYGQDERQKLDVYTPEAKAKDGKAHPVLLFFHGGSWRDGERDGYAFLGRAFAAQGYVTFIADYRKIPKIRFPAFVEDAAYAITWVHSNAAKYEGDPQRLFIMGHSAGAHIAMMTALDPQWLKRNGQDSAIIKGVIGLAGPYDFLPFTTDAAKYAFGKWPNVKETQPINYVRADAPPLLLLTGADDVTVRPRNSEALAAAMTDINGEAILKIYPQIDHKDIIMAVARPFRDKASVIDDSISFMAAH